MSRRKRSDGTPRATDFAYAAGTSYQSCNIPREEEKEIRCIQQKTEEQTQKKRANISSSAAIILPRDSGKHPSPSSTAVSLTAAGSSQRPLTEQPVVPITDDSQTPMGDVPWPIPEDGDQPATSCDSGDPASLSCANENCKKHTESLELECQALRTENILLKEQKSKTGLSEMCLQHNDKKSEYSHCITGIFTTDGSFLVVAPYLKPASALTKFQQYM